MKINQSTQLKNMLAPLRVGDVNVVSSADGIIIAGAHVGIMLDKPAKNRVHLIAICTDERVPISVKDYSNLSEAIDYCKSLISLDKSGKLK